jgi:hypothetical protein
MTKNLETADRIAKVTLSLTTLIFYIVGLIEGPFAMGLMIISVTALLIYLVRIVLHKYG